VVFTDKKPIIFRYVVFARRISSFPSGAPFREIKEETINPRSKDVFLNQPDSLG
jgi:hypothetical protein